MLNKLYNSISNLLAKRSTLYGVAFFIFLLIFILNHYVPLMHDDYSYSLLRHGESFVFPNTLIDIYKYLYSYYWEWGGRVVAHFIVLHLLILPTWLQDILNSCAFVGVVFILYRFATINKGHNSFLLVLLFCTIFLFYPTFVASSLWMTGSGNYTWTILIALSFVFYYYKFYNLDAPTNTRLSRPKVIGLFFLGFIAGDTNENIGPVLFLLVVIYTIAIYFKFDKKVPFWCYLGIVGVALGTTFMIFAPGNAVRSVADGHSELLSSISILPAKISNLWGYYRYFLLYPFLFYIVVWCLMNWTYTGDNKKKILFNSLLFILIANVSLWITIFSPSFPPRAFSTITTLFVVGIGIVLANIDFKKFLFSKIFSILLLLFIMSIFAVSYFKMLRAFMFIAEVTEYRKQEIIKAKQEGKTSISFESVQVDYRYNYSDTPFVKEYYDIDVSYY